MSQRKFMFTLITGLYPPTWSVSLNAKTLFHVTHTLRFLLGCVAISILCGHPSNSLLLTIQLMRQPVFVVRKASISKTALLAFSSHLSSHLHSEQLILSTDSAKVV